MKKSFIIVFLILFLSFINIKIVNAEEYAYCYYNFTNASDNDFKFQRGFDTGKAALIVRLIYHSEKQPNPLLDARLVNSEDVDFSNGYEDEFNLKYSNVECTNVSTICVNKVTNNFNLDLFHQNDSKQLSCPPLYFFKKNNTSSRPYYTFSLFSATSGLGSKIDFDEQHTLQPSSDSKVKNESTSGSTGGNGGSSSGSTSGILASCQYKYTNYNYAAASRTGTVGFSILKDGSVAQIVPSGDLANTTFEYSGSALSSCPKYLKFKTSTWGGDVITISKTDSASDADATYISNVTQSESEAFLYYLAYNGSSSSKIALVKRGSSVYAEVRKTGETSGEVIEISNISTYLSDLTSKDVSKYPTWLNLATDGKTYTLSDKRDNNAKTNYICQQKIQASLDLGGSAVNDTCEDILGSELLKFLDNNVITVIRLGIPLLLILFTTFDFAKVVFIDDKDGIQKATKRFGKRIVAAILVYLVPAILIFLVKIIGADKVEECAEYFNSVASEIDTNQ